MEHLYIAFVDTPGIFAGIIRRYLKQRYVHVVISEDENFENAYSVGRRNPEIPILAGFEKEECSKILHKFPEAYYCICKLDCTREQKESIKKRLEEDYTRRFHIHYAIAGLPFLILGIPFYIKDQYTCSSYLAKILSENGIKISEKHFSLVTPKDFLEYKEKTVIFEGKLSEFVKRGSYETEYKKDFAGWKFVLWNYVSDLLERV